MSTRVAPPRSDSETEDKRPPRLPGSGRRIGIVSATLLDASIPPTSRAVRSESFATAVVGHRCHQCTGRALHRSDDVGVGLVAFRDETPQLLESGGRLPNRLVSEETGRAFDRVCVPDQIRDPGRVQGVVGQGTSARDEATGPLIQLFTEDARQFRGVEVHLAISGRYGRYRQGRVRSEWDRTVFFTPTRWWRGASKRCHRRHGLSRGLR